MKVTTAFEIARQIAEQSDFTRTHVGCLITYKGIPIASEESLLDTVTKEDRELSNKIEIIKSIVTDKLAAAERAKKAAEKKAQNQRILEIMADKQDAALKEKSLEELQAMLETEDYED